MKRFSFLKFWQRRRNKLNKNPTARIITNPGAVREIRTEAFVELGKMVDMFGASGKWTDIMIKKQGQRAYELLLDQDLRLQNIGNRKASNEVNRVREIIKPKLDKLNEEQISPTQFRREVKSALQGLNLKLI